MKQEEDTPTSFTIKPCSIDDFILTYYSSCVMCPNEVTIKRVGEGTNDILFNYGQMKNIHIENWWENMDFSNTRLLTAGILNCISDSFEYELDVLKKGARYDELNSKIKWGMEKTSQEDGSLTG